MKLTHEIYLTDDNENYFYLSVDLEAYPCMEDAGIGKYEFHGQSGFDVRPYLSCERHGITWNKKQYSKWENKIIKTYLRDYYDEIESDFNNEYAKNN